MEETEEVEIFEEIKATKEIATMVVEPTSTKMLAEVAKEANPGIQLGTHLLLLGNSLLLT